jgi:hypothetical protein
MKLIALTDNSEQGDQLLYAFIQGTYLGFVTTPTRMLPS